MELVPAVGHHRCQCDSGLPAVRSKQPVNNIVLCTANKQETAMSKGQIVLVIGLTLVLLNFLVTSQGADIRAAIWGAK